MPRDGAIIFRDLVGVECDKCGRRGRYHLYRLIERYGIERGYRTRYRVQVQRADDS